MGRPFTEIRTLFEEHLNNNPYKKVPQKLYDPVNYLLSLGGKRARPAMALMAHELFSELSDDAYKVAMAIEVFHNFTLMHDDIIDEATTRRAKPTVHLKYNTNTAILSGDAMMIEAYEFIANLDDKSKIPTMFSRFNKHALGVCYGQQYDLEFETRSDVQIDEYIEMIRLKTAVLLGCALSLGAEIAGADEEDIEHLQKFGENIGIAFQLQDDLLDTFGDAETFGKRIGGDIIQNKKTYLYLKALELASDAQKEELVHIYSDKNTLGEEAKIDRVKSLYNELVVQEYALQLMDAYNVLGISHLQAVKVPNEKKQPLIDLCDYLMNRNS